MDNVPKKRGRGRPRKNPVPPEEVFIGPDVGLDLSDVTAGTEPAPLRPIAESEEEVIHLSGTEPEPVPEAVPEAAPVPVEPTIVYLPAPPSETDVAADAKKEKDRRHAALTKIKRYRTEFPAIAAMRFSEDWSTDALESHLEDIRITVSSKTSGMLVKACYVAGTKGIEIVTCNVGMKTYGLSDLLSKNAEIDAILKEIACELGVGHIPATTRLALATLQTVFVLDSVNKRAEVLGTFKGSAVNAEIADKFKDL